MQHLLEHPVFWTGALAGFALASLLAALWIQVLAKAWAQDERALNDEIDRLRAAQRPQVDWQGRGRSIRAVRVNSVQRLPEGLLSQRQLHAIRQREGS